jgi:hypothetical protein
VLQAILVPFFEDKNNKYFKLSEKISEKIQTVKEEEKKAVLTLTKE